MGANLTKENESSWDQEDIIQWKQKAKKTLKSYYLSFSGSQFDEYLINQDENLLIAKICFAIYGSPTVQNVTKLWDGYEEEQKENANEILKLILKIHEEKNNSSKRILVGIVVIICKKEASEYSLPIFSIFTGDDPCNPHAARAYVDTQLRTYASWDDWKKNNTLPMLKYAYPTRGFFTSSSSCTYEFDVDKEPDVEFGTSPACYLTSRVFGTTDIVTGATSLACGVIVVASLLTPVAPAILLASMIGGSSSAVYGTSRAVVRLNDKRTHGGSLTDLESFTLWFSIAATPLHFTTSIVNASLVRGAVNDGRIFSSSMRMFATVLNFSTLGVDGVMVAFGIANLVDKIKQDKLTPLDVLQFSMSVFFFTNTLIQPQMASSIIKNAQEMHIQNKVTDVDAQETFNQFIKSNKNDGTITDNSKIIRAINRIEDPNKFFAEMKDAANIEIGGRKGKTLLVTDKNQNVNRINPSKMSSAETSQGIGPASFGNNTKNSFESATDFKDVEELDQNKLADNSKDHRKIAEVATAISTIASAAATAKNFINEYYKENPGTTRQPKHGQHERGESSSEDNFQREFTDPPTTATTVEELFDIVNISCPENEIDQEILITRHMLHRFIYIWAMVRGLADIHELKEKLGGENVFVREGLLYQEEHNGAGKKDLPSGHLFRGRLNPKLQNCPGYWEGIGHLTAITEPVTLAMNGWEGLSQEIDSLDERLIDDESIDFVQYKKEFLEIFQEFSSSDDTNGTIRNGLDKAIIILMETEGNATNIRYSIDIMIEVIIQFVNKKVTENDQESP